MHYFINISLVLFFLSPFLICRIKCSQCSTDSCDVAMSSSDGETLKILLLEGSVRDGRMSDRVAKFLLSKFSQTNHQVELIDPLKLELPMLKQPLHFHPDQSQAPAILRELNEKIKAADAYILISAEYNRQLPPALTNLIDYFPPRSFGFKSSAILTYSLGKGGDNAAAQARTLMVEVGALPVPYIVHIEDIANKITADGQPNDEYLHRQFDKMMVQLNFYATALKKHRQSVGEPQWGVLMSKSIKI